MSTPTNEELSRRVAELESQVAALQALLERFVTVDEETDAVSLTPTSVRCESVTIYESWDDEADERQEQDRIELCVDAEDSIATVRLFNESGEIAYLVEACDASVATRHYHDGKLRLDAQVDAERAYMDSMYADGETVATRLVTEDESLAGLRVYRPDGSTAVTAGLDGEAATTAVWDNEGAYQLVRLANTGDNLGSIDGWRDGQSRWLQINEIDSGEGGRICMWADSGSSNADVFVVVDAECARVGLRGQRDGTPGIELSSDDEVRSITVNNFLGEGVIDMGVDAAGCVSYPGE